MGWARRAVLLFAGCIGAVLLGIALSIALARPAGAATLPAPTPAVPAAVDTATAPPVTGALPGLVGSPVAIPNAITGVTAAAGRIGVAVWGTGKVVTCGLGSLGTGS